MRVAVIGGGITGLTATYELQKGPGTEVVLFEKCSLTGGKIRTDRAFGLIREEGPDSIFLRNPELSRFIEELGLKDDTISPRVQGFSIWLDGGLRPIPRGVSNPTSIDPEDLFSFPFLSDEAKVAVLAEEQVSPNHSSDESIREFFTRRFGREYSTRIAEPLYAGTHGGDPAKLSMQALYPGLREMERTHGSLARAGRNTPQSSAKFLSFKGGIQTLTDRLSALSKSRTHLNCEVSPFELDGSKVVIAGESFDAAILAVPAYDCAHLLSNLSAGAVGLLNELSFESSTIVTFQFDAVGGEASFCGTGFLTTTETDLGIRGATFSSHKWEGRSPREEILVRVFLRGTILEPVETALRGLRRAIGEVGIPKQTWITRWKNGLPQYTLGHLEWVESVEAELARVGPIFVAGQSYRGAGIPDCILQGQRAAVRVLSRSLPERG